MTMAAAIAGQLRPAGNPPVGESSPPVNRYGWYEAARLAAMFGGRGKMARKRKLTWVGGLPEDQKRKVDGRWQVAGDALLLNGQMVQEFCSAPPISIPDAVKRGGTKHRHAELLRLELLRRDREFQATHTNLGPSTAGYFEELGESHHGVWAHENGLPISLSSMKALRRRAANGEPLCNKFRCGRKRTPIVDRVCAAYDEIALHPNFDSYAEA